MIFSSRTRIKVKIKIRSIYRNRIRIAYPIGMRSVIRCPFHGGPVTCGFSAPGGLAPLAPGDRDAPLLVPPAVVAELAAARLPGLFRFQLGPAGVVLQVVVDDPSVLVDRPEAVRRAAVVAGVMPGSPPHALGSEAFRSSHPRAHEIEVLGAYQTVSAVDRAPEERCHVEAERSVRKAIYLAERGELVSEADRHGGKDLRDAGRREAGNAGHLQAAETA